MRRLPLAVLLTTLAASPARAERVVSAYDPQLHAKPPMMRSVDGESGPLLLDRDFLERAERFRRARPLRDVQAQDGAIVVTGEVVIVQGDEETLETDGSGFRPRIPVITRKLIERFGDHFQAVTLWLTFDERGSSRAEAYEQTVKVDVEGLGMRLRDVSRMYGSQGVLRSILNMKLVWRRVTDDTVAAWTPHLETWGQESGHRWMMFMKFRDPRTGRVSDALLGRDCAHYNRFVETQASVHDGFAWTDKGNGTFEAGEFTKRYSNLDLYGMGLLPAEDVPPFFLIDGIPGYTHPPCAEYGSARPPVARTIQGTRVDIGIADVIAANGERVPSSDDLLAGQRQDYFREAQVIVTLPSETPRSPTVVRLAERLNKARLFWEDWLRTATRNRMVVCTQVTRDCGDLRSDVAEIRFNTARKAPAAGPLTFDVVVNNTGARAASGVNVSLEVKGPAGAMPLTATKPLGVVEPGAMRTQSFEVDLRGVPCGTELAVKATTQSDFHHHRRRQQFFVGGESVLTEGFEGEGAWGVNPDGDDSSQGARWERGTPERTEIQQGQAAQPQGAHGGMAAWVTGAAAVGSAGTATFVHDGKTTLESPTFDASAYREPILRYWASFAGVVADGGGTIAPSPESRLLVLARAVAGAGADAGVGGDGGAAGGWVELDRLQGEVTKGWVQRTARIPAALVGGGLKLRFVAVDDNPRSGGVEAAIDDVEILSLLPACFEPVRMADGSGGGKDDGGCAIGAGRGAPSSLLVMLVVMVIARGRRRRSRGGGGSSA